ncbi:MAG: hypothetical protein S4CHLAM123_13770 [Chlamydiales bacterium]|nr:hypothetical protein [Chlamydiales bacterium]
MQLATRTNSPKNLELVRTLIKLGANINAQDSNGKTPLHIAARDWAYLNHPNAIKIIYALLNYEANTEILDNNQRSALDVTGGRNVARFIASQDLLA